MSSIIRMNAKAPFLCVKYFVQIDPYYEYGAL